MNLPNRELPCLIHMCCVNFPPSFMAFHIPRCKFLSSRHLCSGQNRDKTPHLEDHPRTGKWLGSPPFINHLGHLEGEQPYLGDLRSLWLLATYKSWDDPPSSPPKSPRSYWVILFFSRCRFDPRKTALLQEVIWGSNIHSQAIWKAKSGV